MEDILMKGEGFWNEKKKEMIPIRFSPTDYTT